MSEHIEEVKEKKKKKVNSKKDFSELKIKKNTKLDINEKLDEKSEENEKIIDEPIKEKERKQSTRTEDEMKLKPKEFLEPYEVPKTVSKYDIQALKDIDEYKLIELKEAFNLFDLNGDGIIDAGDLRSTFLTLGQEIGDLQIQQMMSEAISPLDFDAFVVLLGYRTIELDPEDVLLEALSKWDKDGKGLINEDVIRHDLMAYGDKFTVKEANIALEEAPIAKGTGIGFNCSGPVMIDYPAFCKTLGGLRKRTKK